MENRSAGKLGKRDWGIILAVIAIAIAVFALVPDWVTYLETHEEIRVALASYWGWVRHWWPAVVAVVALVVVLVVPRLRGRVLWLLKCLGGMAKRLYLWLLSDVLARPVREELAVRLAEARAVATVGAEGAGSDDDWRRAVADLSVSALQVLYRALLKYDQDGSRVVPLEVSDLREAWAGTTEGVSLKVVREGCRELEAAGFIKGYSAFSRKGHAGVVIPLADWLSGGAAARKVREWSNDELVDRGVWDF